jgi:RND family efflux transporter MFP subunit
VRNLEIRLEKHYFYAPFSGSIITTDLRVGATARNGSRLGQVINLEDLEVEVQLPAEDIVWIDKTKDVTLVSNELHKTWQGKISRIGSSIDTRTQSVSVFVKISMSMIGEIFEGIFLEAHMQGQVVNNAASIPRKAVYRDNFVYCIKDGRLDFRPVKIARRETDSVIITGGLMQGDTLITEILQGVASGMLAKPKLNQSEERSE